MYAKRDGDILWVYSKWAYDSRYMRVAAFDIRGGPVEFVRFELRKSANVKTDVQHRGMRLLVGLGVTVVVVLIAVAIVVGFS
ncbi:MAG: hypothetical protein JSU63_18770 [Phycisphaerales bacterium]|nr:MAG: hypothetical protein JSU63_18770 [Phycisphaerales bacterium]